MPLFTRLPEASKGKNATEKTLQVFSAYVGNHQTSFIDINQYHLNKPG